MDLAELMRDATADVVPPADLLESVRRGGRRRRRARRGISLALVAGVAVLSTVLAVDQPSRSPSTMTFAGVLFDGKEHGDLAHDQAFNRQVIAAWEASHATSLNATRGIFDDLRGAPRVVWAGTTSAGPAAVVTQDAYLHEHPNLQLDHEGIHQLLGFVGPGPDGLPRVVADTYPSPGVSADIAWYVDTQRRVIAAIDTGKTLGVSWKWDYGPNGSTTRTYTPMRPADGVALLTLPEGVRPGITVRIGLLPVEGFDDVRGVLNSVYTSEIADNRLQWLAPSARGLNALDLGGGWQPTRDQLETRFDSALDARLSGGEPFSQSRSLWFAYGVVPDGREVVVGERQLEADPSRIYAVLGSGAGTTVVSAGEVDRAAPLPVKVLLPDNQGWVVAQLHAAIAYRIGPGAWQPAGQDAALLPASATAVEVTSAQGRPVVVELTG